MTRILAIDPSYRMGVAVVDLTDRGEGYDILHTAYAYAQPGRNAYEEVPDRMRIYVDCLIGVVDAFYPEWLIYEAPIGQTTHDAIRCFGRMEGMIVALAIAYKLKFNFVLPDAVKKVAYNWQVLPPLPDTVAVQDKKRGVLTYAWSQYPELLDIWRRQSSREAVADAICTAYAGAHLVRFGLQV